MSIFVKACRGKRVEMGAKKGVGGNFAPASKGFRRGGKKKRELKPNRKEKKGKGTTTLLSRTKEPRNGRKGGLPETGNTVFPFWRIFKTVSEATKGDSGTSPRSRQVKKPGGLQGEGDFYLTITKGKGKRSVCKVS